MKIYITDTAAIGRKCKKWAMDNLPQDTIIVEDMNTCEIFISIFYNKLVPLEFIRSKKRCLNFHGGVLPEYRGSGTINWAIINGEKETGITLHEIDEKIDHGPIIAIKRTPIETTDTAGDLYKKLENIIFEMFKEWLARLVTLDYATTPQDHSKARLYSRKDLRDAMDITRHVRAFEFPGKECAYYTTRNGRKIKLKFN